MKTKRINYQSKLNKKDAAQMVIFLEKPVYSKIEQMCMEHKMSKSDMINGLLKHIEDSEFFKMQRKVNIESRLKQLQKIEQEAQVEARQLAAELRRLQNGEMEK